MTEQAQKSELTDAELEAWTRAAFRDMLDLADGYIRIGATETAEKVLFEAAKCIGIEIE